MARTGGFGMTNEEAIEILKHEHDYAQLLSYVNEALKTAISALEKQIPKNPIDTYDENIYQIDDDDYIHESAQFGSCPACNHEVQDGMLFCSFCGQALDWCDTE